MWLQTCMHFFLLRNTKDDILKAAGNQTTLKPIVRTKKERFLKTSSFMVSRRKIWSDMRARKLSQNFYFWMEYPFKQTKLQEEQVHSPTNQNARVTYINRCFPRTFGSTHSLWVVHYSQIKAFSHNLKKFLHPSLPGCTSEADTATYLFKPFLVMPLHFQRFLPPFFSQIFTLHRPQYC